MHPLLNLSKITLRKHLIKISYGTPSLNTSSLTTVLREVTLIVFCLGSMRSSSGFQRLTKSPPRAVCVVQSKRRANTNGRNGKLMLQHLPGQCFGFQSAISEDVVLLLSVPAVEMPNYLKHVTKIETLLHVSTLQWRGDRKRAYEWHVSLQRHLIYGKSFEGCPIPMWEWSPSNCVCIIQVIVIFNSRKKRGENGWLHFANINVEFFEYFLSKRCIFNSQGTPVFISNVYAGTKTA